MDEDYGKMSHEALTRASQVSEKAIFWSMVVAVVGIFLVMVRVLVS